MKMAPFGKSITFLTAVLLLSLPHPKAFGQSACQDQCYTKQGQTLDCCASGGFGCIPLGINPVTDCPSVGVPTFLACMKQCPAPGAQPGGTQVKCTAPSEPSASGAFCVIPGECAAGWVWDQNTRTCYLEGHGPPKGASIQ